MELKLGCDTACGIEITSSNRTFMELKYITSKIYGDLKEVLIAPLWN